MDSQSQYQKTDKSFLRQIIHTWNTIWFPIYGEDFDGFCGFVLKNYNIDISKNFCIDYNNKLRVKTHTKPKNIPVPVSLPKKEIKMNGES